MISMPVISTTFLEMFLLICLPHQDIKKVRQPKSTHRKTQTSIAATQTKIELGYYHNHLVELAFLPSLKMIMAKKGYNIPIKTKIPLILIFSLCSIFIIPQFLKFVNIFSGFLQNHLPRGRKIPSTIGCAFYTCAAKNFLPL
jgi:hypothetical protein